MFPNGKSGFNLVLYQPEIPQNTGAIMRLCAATKSDLHLIEPLGFTLTDKGLKRAGMDYRERVDYHRHAHVDDCQRAILAKYPRARFFALTTKASHSYARISFRAGDALILGPESRGLPSDFLAALPPEQCLRIPMATGERSLNLSQSASIVLFEALRQLDFPGLG